MSFNRNDGFFAGYKTKQFLLFFLCEDPWSYLRNYRIPNEINVLSGLKGYKRRPEDIEALVIGDKFSWLRIDDKEFYVYPTIFEEMYLLRSEIIKGIIPIPYLKGEINKDRIIIWRDPINFHPLYFARLPDGYIVSPRKEWIRKLRYRPEEAPLCKKITVEKYSLDIHTEKFEEKNTDNIISKVIKNIIQATRILKSKFEEIYLILSGDVGDFVLMSILEEINVISPMTELSKFLRYEKVITHDLKFTAEDKQFILEKIEDKAKTALLHGILHEKTLKTLSPEVNSIFISGYGLCNTIKDDQFHSFSREEALSILHEIYKAIWPDIIIPMIFAGENRYLLNKIQVQEILKALNIDEVKLKHYLKAFEKFRVPL